MKKKLLLFIFIFLFVFVPNVHAAEGDSFEEAIDIIVDQTPIFKNWGEDMSEKQYQRFVNEEKGILRLRLYGPRTNSYGFKIIVYNSSKNPIWNTNVDIDTSEYMYYHIGLDSGTYYISIEPTRYDYTFPGSGHYTGTISTSAQYTFGSNYSTVYDITTLNEIEPNDTESTATLIKLNSYSQGYFGIGGGDVNLGGANDYYKIYLTSGHSYRLYDGNIGTVASISLTAPDNSLINLTWNTDDSGARYSDFTASSSGYYYIRIYNYTGKQTAYKLGVFNNDNLEAILDMNLSPITIGDDYSIVWIPGMDILEGAKLVLNNDGIAHLELSKLPMRDNKKVYDIELYNDNALIYDATLDCADESENPVCDLYLPLEAGTYYLGIKNVSGYSFTGYPTTYAIYFNQDDTIVSKSSANTEVEFNKNYDLYIGGTTEDFEENNIITFDVVKNKKYRIYQELRTLLGNNGFVSVIVEKDEHEMGMQEITYDKDFQQRGYAEFTSYYTGKAYVYFNANTDVQKHFTVGVTDFDISKASIVGLVDKAYTGEEVLQSINVKLNNFSLKYNTEYTVSYENNINPGTATIIINGIGNYYGELRETFKINGSPLSNATVSGVVTKKYTGEAITQNPIVTLNTTVLRENIDYYLEYRNNINAGTAKVVIRGMGQYSGTIVKTFTISKKSIGSTTISGIVQKKYTGSEITLNLNITYNGTALVEGTDYEVAYSNNINAGNATVTITGKGNFKGTYTKTFKISRKSIGSATIKGIANKKYTGSAITLPIVITFNGEELVLGTDYKVLYENNINAGTATVNIIGLGNFEGTYTKTFTISPKSIGSITIEGITNKIYTGKSITLSLALSYNGHTLVLGKDYDVCYINNIDVGKAKVEITGLGNYTKVYSRTFVIKPKATSISAISGITDGFKLQWKKQTIQIDGYQIEYSLNSDYSNSKTIKVGNTITSKDITGLGSNKTYYVRIKTYKTVNGTTIYSNSSVSKTITTK